MKILRAILILALHIHGAYAQCPVADFTIPATACLSGNFQIQNTTVADTYDWDFCSGDLYNTPTAQLAFTLSGANGRPGIELVKDGNVWYGFVTGTFSNNLWRLTFANGLISAPSQVDNLGSLGGILNSPGPVRIFNNAGSWYGLIYNAATADLVKLSFGSQLSNPISTSLLSTGITAGESSLNAGLAVAYDGINGWVCVLTNALKQFITLRLGTSITSPGPADRIVISISANNLGDVDIIRICDQWYGFAADFGNGNIYRLKFGTSLFQTPLTDLAASVGIVNAGRIRILPEGNEYFLLTPSLDGDLHKVNFGTDINQNSPVVSNEGNFSSLLVNAYGLAVAKENSVWNVLVVDFGSGKINRVSYSGICTAIASGTTQQFPEVRYTAAGNQNISLTMVVGGLSATVTKTIAVSAASAPDIDFSNQNSCAQNAINFTSQNASGNIISYAWDFGDGQTSSSQHPGNVYVLAGTYTSRLNVAASNSCQNLVSKTIVVYNAPVSDFTLPPATPFCTNQNYLLTNISSFDAASNPAWEWRVNGVLLSTQKDFTTVFSSAVAQDIRLKALIPGCSNEMIKTISSVSTGPSVDFSVNNNCTGVAIPFSNTTTGTVTGYQWSFGDGAISTFPNPNHTYSGPSVYQVTLTASNAAGCQNFITKPITVYSLPQPDFSVSLPPFSCANSPTQFQNNTPALSDGNISAWTWQFGDSGISGLQNPSHTYTVASVYTVSLLAVSDKGCSGSNTKPITISASPTADFTLGPACLNLSTKFTDTSSGNIQSRLWQIASSTFSIPDPSYTFTASGDYATILTTTGSNGCISVKSRTVTVPVPPIVNFTNSLPCSGKSMVFTDVTDSPQDVPVGWNWNFAGNSAIGNPASYVFTPDGVYNIKLTTTHNSGCKYTLSKNININPSPVASFTATPDRGAAPLIIQFDNTSSQATHYLWKFYDKVTATSTLTSPTYTFATLGDYSAELTASNSFGCSDVLTVPIKVLVPSIDLVMKDFSLTHDPVTGKLKCVVSILNNCNIPISAAEVALFLADKAVVNETLILNLAPGQSAARTLSFTLSPQQFDFSYLCAEILSEKDIQPDNNKRCLNLDQTEYVFAPYPNPTSGTLHIDWISPVSGSARLIIYDQMGKKSFEWDTLTQSGLNQGVLDISFLTAGIYYLTIETGGIKKSMRFLRE